MKESPNSDLYRVRIVRKGICRRLRFRVNGRKPDAWVSWEICSINYDLICLSRSINAIILLDNVARICGRHALDHHPPFNLSNGGPPPHRAFPAAYHVRCGWDSYTSIFLLLETMIAETVLIFP